HRISVFSHQQSHHHCLYKAADTAECRNNHQVRGVQNASAGKRPTRALKQLRLSFQLWDDACLLRVRNAQGNEKRYGLKGKRRNGGSLLASPPCRPSMPMPMITPLFVDEVIPGVGFTCATRWSQIVLGTLPSHRFS